MKICNKDGFVNLSENSGIIGDNNKIFHLNGYVSEPEVERIAYRKILGLTYRHLVGTGISGLIGFFASLYELISGISESGGNLFYFRDFPPLWIPLTCFVAMIIGAVGWEFRGNRVLKFPFVAVEKGRSGKLYVVSFSGKCPECGGLLRQERRACDGFRVSLSCENNSREHRWYANWAKLPAIDD